VTRRVPFAAALALGALLAAQLAGGAELEIPAKFQEAVARANQLGRQIFVHDLAASRATDVLFERKALPDDKRVRGWLTDLFDKNGKPGILVTFVGETDRGTMALYRVLVFFDNGESEFARLDTPLNLEESQQARWKARGAAIQLIEARKDLCGERYNSVVLPAPIDASDGIRVYMLAATSQPDLMIAGGHFLYEYSADGKTLMSQRAFTRSCIDIPLAADPEKGELKAVTLTHLLDPTPTEIHVFMSRNYGKTMMLATTQNSLAWVIAEGEIVGARSYKK